MLSVSWITVDANPWDQNDKWGDNDESAFYISTTINASTSPTIEKTNEQIMTEALHTQVFPLCTYWRLTFSSYVVDFSFQGFQSLKPLKVCLCTTFYDTLDARKACRDAFLSSSARTFCHFEVLHQCKGAPYCEQQARPREGPGSGMQLVRMVSCAGRSGFWALKWN